MSLSHQLTLGGMQVARAIQVIALAVFFVACGGGGQSSPAAQTAEVDMTQADREPGLRDDGEGALVAGDMPARVQGPTSEQVPVEADDPIWGQPEAPVTLVMFSDFQCPFCARVYPTVEELKREYGPETLRIVYKHNPLPFHKDALPAAIASQAVFELAGASAFFAYADALFLNQRSLSDQTLVALARQVGVERSALFRTVREPRVRAKVERDMELARRIGATGTPAFRINGATLVGAQPVGKFRELIDQEKAAARELTQAGTKPGQVYAKRVAVNYTPPSERPERDEPNDSDVVYKVPIDKSPTRGPATALVTMVEFTDFECPYCRRSHKTVAELEQRYKGKLRVVFKHNPLPFHKGALPAAILAEEARAQRGDAGFWAATEKLFTADTPMDQESLLEIAKELKLHPGRAKLALEKERHKDRIEKDQNLAMDLEARGTPAYFINGRRLSGAQPVDKFAKLIDEELAKAEKLVADKKIPSVRVYAEIMKDAKAPPPPETKTVPAPSAKHPSRGPKNAPVVVQVFSDFQCPFCARAVPTMEELEKAFPGKVRIVWRNLPLPFHKDAPLAAAAALEAHAQKGDKGFWEMHDLLFENQRAEGGLKRPALEQYAQKIGLDLARFNKALDAGTHDAAIQADEQVAKTASISGTPGFVINGYFVSGAQPLRAFEKVVKLALDDVKKGKRRP